VHTTALSHLLSFLCHPSTTVIDPVADADSFGGGHTDANGEFYSTFKNPRVAHRELDVHLAAPSPSFSMLCVSDLLPPNRIQEYEIAGGDVI
jgi:hypothetical protein